MAFARLTCKEHHKQGNGLFREDQNGGSPDQFFPVVELVIDHSPGSAAEMRRPVEIMIQAE
jgi:hypothetical protein